MTPSRPPDFATIADANTQSAFILHRPDVVEWFGPGVKLFKWTQRIMTPKGVTPWWSFLEPRRLSNGASCPGIRQLQGYAARLGVHDRDYARARSAVTQQWNKMTDAVAIELTRGAWAYVGRASGQLRDETMPDVYFIGGEYQAWIPGLTAVDIRRISILPYLEPNTPFGAK